MNISSTIDSVLTEGRNLDIQRFQLYVDLNHKLLSKMKKSKPSEEEIIFVGKTYHTEYYQDLSMNDVKKIKNKFIEDAMSKKNFDIAMGSLDNFIQHINKKDE